MNERFPTKDPLETSEFPRPRGRRLSLRLLLVVVLGLALLAAACGSSSSSASGESAPIRITSPADGATVGRQFTVTLDPGVPIGEPGTGRHHVHLYYDGNRSTNQADYDIAYSPSFTVTRLTPGPHTIEAVIANADHSVTDTRTQISVTVADSGGDAPMTSTPAAPTTTPDNGGYSNGGY